MFKSEEEWTEEEMRAAREYERRCKELQDEREKYRKQLETEMKKTQKGIEEGLHHFDEMLTQVSLFRLLSFIHVYI